MRLPGTVTLLVVATIATLSAQSWPQWRGPNRDGQTTAAAPATFAQAPTTVWKVPVGIGHASPLVEGDRVYVFARRDEREVVQALDLATGKAIWTQQYDAPYTMNPAAASHGKGPKSTPVLASGRLCTFGISGVLSCFEAASGKLLWRRSFEKEFPPPIAFGTAMSPIVEGGLLVAHVGGEGRGALRAFDHATGTPRWSWTGEGEGPAYASPVALAVGGSRQIVTQTQTAIVAVDAATGAHLWAIPFKTPYEQNSVTPLVVGDLVVLSGLDQETFAVRPVKTAAAWSAEKVWANRAVPMYMSSPVLVRGVIVGFTHRNRGQLFAIDAKTGATRWTGPPRQGENAALVASGNRVLALTNGAELVVVRADGPGFEELARIEVATSPTWAHPVLLGSRLLVKDEQALALLQIG
jgi:outer membrane protein assembly factor BamB